MRILYLLYAQQEPFTDSGDGHRSRFPWTDTLLDELVKEKSITIGLAVPVNGTRFQVREEKGITLFGLPNPSEKNFFRKLYNRYIHYLENADLNLYAARAIEEFDPDIIQVFGTENPFGLIAKEQSKPVVIHIQGYLMVCQKKWFTGLTKWQQFRYGSFKELLLKTGSFSEFIDFRIRALREESIMKACRYFMGRTSFDKRLVSLLSPGSDYFHCEEFIRTVFLKSNWNFPLGDEVTCVSILKGTTYKGIDLLAETFLVLKKFTHLKIHLKICGVTENEEVVEIIRKKFKIEFSNVNIEFLGRLNADQLVNQLCHSNFYIHPSYIENSPNSVCEAMALGMPVISTNVGGVSSMISDGVDGILVQEGEPYSMAAAIYDLINNYEYAKLLGENARKRSASRHDPDQIVKQLLGIYETIFNKNDRRQ